MNRAKVYVVMEPRKQRDSGNLTKQFDISSAEQYGEIVEQAIFPLMVINVDPQWMVNQAQEVLYDFDNSDSIIAIGDPVAIGIAVAVAASINNGTVSILRWSPRSKSYDRITINTWGENDGNK